MFKKLFLRDINFPSEIKINEKIFKIEILFLKKRHANVILKENKLIFRISKYLTNQKKLNCFEELLEKMKKKIEKNPKEFKEKYGIKKVIKNRSFKFFEKIYFLDISKNYKNFSYTKNVFKIPQDKEMKIIENFISKKLIQENSSFLIERINYLNEKTF